jgi:ribonuclease HI
VACTVRAVGKSAYVDRARRLFDALSREARRIMPTCSTRAEFDQALEAAARGLRWQGLAPRDRRVIIARVAEREWNAPAPEPDLLPEQEEFFASLRAEVHAPTLAPTLPSPEELEAPRSPTGGYTKATLAEWGIPWPAPKGWRQDLLRRWREANPDAPGTKPKRSRRSNEESPEVESEPVEVVGRSGRMLYVEFDGGSRGNPGPAGYGATVRDGESKNLLIELWGNLGRSTNNVAEYTGLIHGLEAALELDPGAEIHVRGDSDLVIKIASGKWKAKDPRIVALRDEARSLARGHRVTYTWVPREANEKADALSNEGMDKPAADATTPRDAPTTFPTGARSRTPPPGRLPRRSTPQTTRARRANASRRSTRTGWLHGRGSTGRGHLRARV